MYIIQKKRGITAPKYGHWSWILHLHNKYESFSASLWRKICTNRKRPTVRWWIHIGPEIEVTRRSYRILGCSKRERRLNSKTIPWGITQIHKKIGDTCQTTFHLSMQYGQNPHRLEWCWHRSAPQLRTSMLNRVRDSLFQLLKGKYCAIGLWIVTYTENIKKTSPSCQLAKPKAMTSSLAAVRMLVQPGLWGPH